jgi:hypothetical protein
MRFAIDFMHQLLMSGLAHQATQSASAVMFVQELTGTQTQADSLQVAWLLIP